jgi:hypothetical protein
MWDETDKQHYIALQKNNVGQIANDSFSADIQKYASNTSYKTYLEIGTWNGLGSTKAFSDGFSRRTDTGYILYSLECNKEKCQDAMELYKSVGCIRILNEVIWNRQPSNFYEVFPEVLSDKLFKHWHEVDIINMQRCKVFLERQDIPHQFDVVLLDGGEFTTYHDFQLLKDRCKVLMLDDVHASKCKQIVKELKGDSSWKIVREENLRNGYLIAERGPIDYTNTISIP